MKMWNPYLDEFKKHKKDDFAFRDYAIKKYAFAVPSEKAIDVCLALSPLVEIGAGTGYWARVIEKAGGIIEAFDITPGVWVGKRSRTVWTKMWFNVQEGDTSAVDLCPGANLLLVWPYMDDMAYEAAKRCTGEYIIYVGEGPGGGTANDKFFQYVGMGASWMKHANIVPRFKPVEEVDIQHFYGINDYMTVLKRL